mmetsp:Transcript_630/g.2273  ORF Transcript_630/g.2273 Transcript_630/m.2273 type:complete len:230 (+) Transcript_630:441-1130(+)
MTVGLVASLVFWNLRTAFWRAAAEHRPSIRTYSMPAAVSALAVRSSMRVNCENTTDLTAAPDGVVNLWCECRCDRRAASFAPMPAGKTPSASAAASSSSPSTAASMSCDAAVCSRQSGHAEECWSARMMHCPQKAWPQSVTRGALSLSMQSAQSSPPPSRMRSSIAVTRADSVSGTPAEAAASSPPPPLPLLLTKLEELQHIRILSIALRTTWYSWRSVPSSESWRTMR